jgi:hypothetical protein
MAATSIGIGLVGAGRMGAIWPGPSRDVSGRAWSPSPIATVGRLCGWRR